MKLRARALAMTLLTALILLLATAVGAVPAQSPLEYPLKAAFLYNLVKFVEWPASSSSGPITLGILGRDPFGATLEQLLRDKDLDGRPLLIHYISRAEELKSYHLVFIAASEKDRLGEILGALKDANTLTVSEIERFAERGGMVHLMMENKKVRFEVNVDTVSRARLKISARFLQLANVVRDRDRERK